MGVCGRVRLLADAVGRKTSLSRLKFGGSYLQLWDRTAISQSNFIQAEMFDLSIAFCLKHSLADVQKE